MLAQTEVGHATGHDPRLVYLAGAKLQPRTDAERVVLAASVAKGLELHVHREVAVPEIVAQQSRRAGAVDQHEIFVAILVDVRYRDCGRPGRAHRSWNHVRPIEKTCPSHRSGREIPRRKLYPRVELPFPTTTRSSQPSLS